MANGFPWIFENSGKTVAPLRVFQPSSPRLCTCAHPSIPPKCARELPKEHYHWLCVAVKKNLRFFFSEIAFRSDCQMTCRGSKLDSTLNSTAWLTSCEGFMCSEIREQTVLSLNYLRSVEDAEIGAVSLFQPLSSRLRSRMFSSY